MARAIVVLPVPGSPCSTSHSRLWKCRSTAWQHFAHSRPLPTAAGQRGDRRRAGGPRLRHLGRGQLHLQHPARGAPVDPARPHLHPRDDPGGQVEQQHPALGVHRLDGAGDERGLVGGVDQLARPVVAHDEVGAHREHRHVAASAGGEVVVQQGQLAGARLVHQRGLDLPRDAGHRRGHEPSGVLAPAREVDDAEQLAADRVPNGCARAGELRQRLDVVLVPEHLGRAAALQRGADAVGADELLRVAEAGGQPDPVQRLRQRRVAGAPLEHDPVGVGEDDAHGLARELVGDRIQHRPGRPHEL